MKERHWNSLVATLRRGQSVLVLGPEVPVGSALRNAAGAPPDDASFSDELARALASELEDENQRAGGKRSEEHTSELQSR